MSPYSVVVLVGSLRKESFNRRIALALAALAPDRLKLTQVEIGDLPFYDQDLEANPPVEWLAFRQTILAADAVLFVTPEYNRTLPAALKNALDVGSRPYGRSAWNGKPGAVVSVTAGALGGFGAHHDLRRALVFLNVTAMAQPEAYISNAATLFDDTGVLSSGPTEAFLKTFIDAFAEWIGRLAPSNDGTAAR